MVKEQTSSGSIFRGILNDLKRRPEDAARELGLSVEYINEIIEGKKEITHEIIEKATTVWPVNSRDFYMMHDDCHDGVKIMRAEDSKKSSRIMNRAGNPYYEYRDTAMSSVAPFRPEWILELCTVGDNEPNNPDVQWNNGHFMHQFTYFIGDVNFYYKIPNGEKQIAIMNAGDSMYITPFVSHSFVTRKGASKKGLILALTYGNKVVGDAQQELSALSAELGSEFALDFSTMAKTIASLLAFHRETGSIGVEELSRRTGISVEKLHSFENAKEIPDNSEYAQLANALNTNVRDLLPNDSIEDKVIVKHYNDGRRWFFPESTRTYELIELASTKNLPYSKALEIKVLENNDEDNLDLKAGLHQYGYNVGETNIQMNWHTDGKYFHEVIKPGDSFYIKPFVKHNFRGNGKLVILRIGGKVVGDPQRELSFIGKENVQRAIAETMQWYDPKGKN